MELVEKRFGMVKNLNHNGPYLLSEWNRSRNFHQRKDVQRRLVNLGLH